MTANIGKIDRILRAVIGAILLYLAFLSGVAAFDAALYKYGAAIVGGVLLVTAFVKTCPIYKVLGIRT